MKEKDKSGISNRMKEVRKQNEMTQQEVADLLKTSRSVYSRVEVHNYPPNLDHVISFAKHFKVDLNWLVFGLRSGTFEAQEYTDDYSLSAEDPIERIKILRKMVDALENNIKDKEIIIAYQQKEIEGLKRK